MVRENKKYVLFCTDNNGVQDLGVCLESLFTNNKYSIEVFVLHSEELEKKSLNSVANKWSQKLTFIKVDPEPIKKLPLNGWPEATYYRLLAPRYLPKYCKKILYLDTDTLVDADISALFDYDLSSFSVGACPSPDSKEDIGHVEDRLGIKRGTHFGAGVLLINLDKVRKTKSFDKLIDFGNKNPKKISAVDQDLLNIFFSEDYFKFSPKFHCALFNGYTTAIPKNQAKIIHYTGRIKARYYLCLHPLRKRYLFYLKKTPWKDNYEKFTLERFVKREFYYLGRRTKNSRIGKKLIKPFCR